MSASTYLIPPAIQPPRKQLPFFKALHTTLDNPMEGWPQAVYEEPIYVPPRRDFRTIYVCDPDALKTILLDRVEDFPKSEMTTRLLRPLLGDGLLTSGGPRWRWQRQVSAPAFHANRVRAAGAPMAAAAANAIARWRRRGDEVNLELTGEMIAITLDIIMDSMMDDAGTLDAQEMSARAATYLMSIGRPNVADALGAPSWMRGAFAPKSTAAVSYLRKAIDAMIARRRNGEQRDDLVDMLMRARDPETGRAMTDADLRDNLMTFWAAGHETTGVALTWAIYLVARHSETETRILHEVDRICGDEPITAAAAQHLIFTKQVVQEAMRLYPPAPLLTRTCKTDCVLGGCQVRAGDIVVIPIYALHRHSLHWNEPNRFDPDRFEPSRGLDKRRFVYMPFGAGPRICIGASFATLEATIVLGELVRAVSFSVDPARSVRPLYRVTMRPEGGLPITARSRRNNDPRTTTNARANVHAHAHAHANNGVGDGRCESSILKGSSQLPHTSSPRLNPPKT